MVSLSLLRRISALALVAMVMVVFAPTISKVVAAERVDSNLVEVCTVEGMRWVSVSGIQLTDSSAHPQEPSSLHDHGGDCPYCNLQSTKFLSVASPSFAAAPVVSLLPSLFYQAPKPLFAWAHSRSRAPPLSV
jgi:hypothetical protein